MSCTAYLVLSHAGYLHEYDDADALLDKPNTTLCLPSCSVGTIIPRQLDSKEKAADGSKSPPSTPMATADPESNPPTSTGFQFTIFTRMISLGHRETERTFASGTREELETWRDAILKVGGDFGFRPTVAQHNLTDFLYPSSGSPPLPLPRPSSFRVPRPRRLSTYLSRHSMRKELASTTTHLQRRGRNTRSKRLYVSIYISVWTDRLTAPCLRNRRLLLQSLAMTSLFCRK